MYWYNTGIAAIDYGEELNKIETIADIVKQLQKKISPAVKAAQLQPITDGMYKIKINQTGKFLAIEGISKDNGARLVQWGFVEQDNHRVYVKDIGNGYYVISAVHSGRYLNASGQSKNDGTPIIQWDYAEQDNVKRRIYYSNQLGNPGWVLENKNASPIRLSSGNNADNNGEPFILMLPKRLDANDYEPLQTFSFEKIRDINQVQTEKIANLFAATGQMTLTHYVSHLTIGILLFTLISGKQDAGHITNQASSPAFILLFYVLYFIFNFVFSACWTTKHKNGPLETLMRKISG